MRRAMLFTLIELLVVVAIMGILLSLLLPSLAKARDAVKSTACKNNLKNQALCYQMYLDASGGFYPSPNGAEDALRLRWYGKLLTSGGIAAESDAAVTRYLMKPSNIFMCPKNPKAMNVYGIKYGINSRFFYLAFNFAPTTLATPLPLAKVPKPSILPAVICGNAWVVYDNSASYLFLNGLTPNHGATTNALYYDGHVVGETKVVSGNGAGVNNWLAGSGF